MNSRKRNITLEIQEKASRLPIKSSRWELFSMRNTSLSTGLFYLSSLENNNNSVMVNGVCLPVGHDVFSELYKYAPLSIVAGLESYFRTAIKDLINQGNPFRENAKKLKDVNLSMEIALNIADDKISIGDFISHILPINNLNDINKHLSIIIE